MPGIPLEWERIARDKGLLATAKPTPQTALAPVVGRPKRKKKELLPSVFVPPNAFIVPVEVVSLNAAKSMRATMGRKASQRAAVCQLLGKHLDVLVPYAQAFHAGKPIVVRLARLGGRGLDSDNLAGSMKWIRDSVADMIGANDKSPLICWEYQQFDNERIGVRIVLEHT